MKIRAFILLYGLLLWVASPAFAQNNGNGKGGGDGSGKGHGHGRGHSDKGGPDNGSDKGGPDDNGSDKDDHDDGKSDKGDHHGSDTRLVATTAEVVTALAGGSLTTSSGAAIPVSAQVKVYAVFTRSGATTSSAPQLPTTDPRAVAATKEIKERLAANLARLSEPLATAGPGAEAALPALMSSLSGLAYNPDWLPTAVTDYNTFVQAASASFLANPPPEFVALHAALAKMTAAAVAN